MAVARLTIGGLLNVSVWGSRTLRRTSPHRSALQNTLFSLGIFDYLDRKQPLCEGEPGYTFASSHHVLPFSLTLPSHLVLLIVDPILDVDLGFSLDPFSLNLHLIIRFMPSLELLMFTLAFFSRFLGGNFGKGGCMQTFVFACRRLFVFAGLGLLGGREVLSVTKSIVQIP